MKTLRVNIPNREYDILIEKGLLAQTGKLLSTLRNPCKVAIITDSNVLPLYSAQVKQSLETSGFDVNIIEIPAGEASKSSKMLESLYSQLINAGITRSDLIIALGGGVVGDLVGFAAATLFRGIDFVQIPTTLLAQVDSSVGGKVAINLPEGKNLVGAFYQPKMVIIDTETLQTLPPRVLSDGCAEVIKYGAIRDEKLFETLEKINEPCEIFENIDSIIYTCCDIKRAVVENDELDLGERMILNFGHTFGHAIEKHYNYSTYTHGEAIGVGMIMESEFGEKIGITPIGTAAKIEKLLTQFNLPTNVDIDANAIAAGVSTDKKGEGNLINLILLKQIGAAIIHKIPKSEVTL
ncbi:MAG: 3-dehydroquinate synthase [Oscillospiraceae bacterium]|nr:3-dehydroquinate synthase [Oscillospiraceae bacterium]